MGLGGGGGGGLTRLAGSSGHTEAAGRAGRRRCRRPQTADDIGAVSGGGGRRPKEHYGAQGTRASPRALCSVPHAICSFSTSGNLFCQCSVCRAGLQFSEPRLRERHPRLTPTRGQCRTSSGDPSAPSVSGVPCAVGRSRYHGLARVSCAPYHTRFAASQLPATFSARVPSAAQACSPPGHASASDTRD